MTTIVFENKTFDLNPKETVLACLLRQHVDYPHSCQSGICQACLIKATSGEINPVWQDGLPETLKSQGYFLACRATPHSPLVVVPPEQDDSEYSARILEMTLLNHNVMQLKLTTEHLEQWIPGQYLHFLNSERTIRSYSIANIPKLDGFIELHIKLYADGRMGQWLLHKAQKNSPVTLRGPFGHCFYQNPHQQSFDMLLAGTGTGLAPLIAIIKTALHEKHQGNITLIHGGLKDEDIYYDETLQQLSAFFPHFNYTACVLKSDGKYPENAIEKHVLSYLSSPASTRVYVCGPQITVDKLKKHIFLAGVPSQAILSDVFLSNTP